MSGLDNFKKIMLTCADFAKVSLEQEDCVLPFLIGSKDGIGFEEMTLDFRDGNVDMQFEEIKLICLSNPDFQYVGLIIDMDCVVVDKDKVSELHGKDLHEVDGVSQAIYLIIYMRDGSWVKTYPYKKDGDQYFFGETDWSNPTLGGFYVNPLLKQE